MEHGLELISPRLEILEIEVFNIIYNPGNIGNWIFFNFLISWKYWKLDFSNFLLSWKYWNLVFRNFLLSWKYGRRAGGSSGQVFPAWIIFGTLFLEFPGILEILQI